MITESAAIYSIYLESQRPLTLVYRAFGVPFVKLFTQDPTTFHVKGKSLTTHDGSFVALDKKWVKQYGSDLGGIERFEFPLLATFAVDPKLVAGTPTEPSEGNAFRLHPRSLTRLVQMEMLIFGKWVSFNRRQLMQYLHTKRGMRSYLKSVEIAIECPNEECPSNDYEISATEVNIVPKLCNRCKAKQGLNYILPLVD